MSTLTDPVTGETFEFRTRAEWGARAPRYRNAIWNTSGGTFMHHTVTGTAPADAIVRGVQNYHMDANGWSDIAYSWLIDVINGVIYEGRGLGIAGGHTYGYNHTSHAICWIANTNEVNPTEVAKRAWLAVLHTIESHYGQGPRRGHRDVATTACPGGFGYTWLAQGFPLSTPDPTPPPPPAPEPTPPPAPRVLGFGDTGDDVKQWQTRLAQRGYWIAADGIFGSLTEGITKWFQEARGVGADGLVGPQTRAAMDAAEAEGWRVGVADPTPAPPAPPPPPPHPPWPGRYLKNTRPMMSGDDVRTWQARMAQRGWKITVDGWYGKESDKVCRGFQRDKGLLVDGIVGPSTWNAAWTTPVT